MKNKVLHMQLTVSKRSTKII